jgi:aryl-alcohol dehydrogenase-like predicted oxidoreductase
MKFSLGTANIAQSYGVTNKVSLNPSESAGLLVAAAENGITSFDTAASYGTAESTLGDVLKGNKKFEITSKIVLDKSDSINTVDRKLDATLENLRVKSIRTLLFHNNDAYQNPKFARIVDHLIHSNRVEKIGLSVYSQTEIFESLNETTELKVFQVPENIVDRRLIESQEMLKLKECGIDIDVRSVFLQGLLLVNKSDLPEKFKNLSQHLDALDELASGYGANRLDVCLSYINMIEWKNNVIIGAHTPDQLNAICSFRKIDIDFEAIPLLDENIRDPRFW